MFNHGPPSKNRAQPRTIRKVNLAPGETLGQRAIRKVASATRVLGVFEPNLDNEAHRALCAADHRKLCLIMGIDPKTGEFLSPGAEKEGKEKKAATVLAVPSQPFGNRVLRRGPPGSIKATRIGH